MIIKSPPFEDVTAATTKAEKSLKNADGSVFLNLVEEESLMRMTVFKKDTPAIQILESNLASQSISRMLPVLTCSNSNWNNCCGGCGYKFPPNSASDSLLHTAVAAFNADSTAAEATYGPMNCWDVSDITYVKQLFDGNSGAQVYPIGCWDVSGITNMEHMFYNSKVFNSDISAWDVSRVTNMGGMFWNAVAFNSDISGWDVSHVTTMQGMFYVATAFNSDISGWDVSRVTIMDFMFQEAKTFNKDISRWDVGRVTDMNHMFAFTTAFNSDIGSWNVSRVTNMAQMFGSTTAFNSNIKGWDVGRVTTMQGMFYGAQACNSDISGWDVSRVTNMISMFWNAVAFNSDISRWDVGRVTNMEDMFYFATAFNKDIHAWDVSQVTNMVQMFTGATTFNSKIDAWNVGRVTNMKEMFYYAAAFNNDISAWNVSQVISMKQMFYNATVFNSHISGWNVNKVTDMYLMLTFASSFRQSLCPWYNKLSNTTNVGEMLIGSKCTLKENPDFSTKSSFCESCAPKIVSFTNPEWTIVLKTSSATVPITVYGEDTSYFLNFTTGKHATRLSVFSSDCVTGVTPPGVLSVGLPDIVSASTTSQDVAYPYSFNIASLAGSNVYTRASSSAPQAFLVFCARLDLLDNTNQSVSFLNGLVNITLDMSKLVNITVDNTAVNETALAVTQGRLGFNATLEACICDPEDTSFSCVASPPVLDAFSYLSVCVGITSATASGVIIDHVMSYTINQYGTGITLISVDDGLPSSLTEITVSGDKKSARIKTQLYSSIFEGLTANNKADRKLKADGTILLKLPDGSRQLMSIHRTPLNRGSIRALEQERQHLPKAGIASSAFAVDSIAINESPDVKVPGMVGGLNLLILFVVVGAAAGLLALFVAKASKKKNALKKNSGNTALARNG